MNLGVLLQFVPLIFGLFLAYHLIFKRNLPEKSILEMVGYIVGILVILLVVSWLITSFLADWTSNLLTAGTDCPAWSQVIDQSEQVFDDAFGTEDPIPTAEPTPVQIQQIVVTATPIPGGTILREETENGTGPVRYTVQAGDTLTSIARRYNTSVSEIKRINGLQSDFILAGQVLIIPQN
jgi:hypothetical protein